MSLPQREKAGDGVEHVQAGIVLGHLILSFGVADPGFRVPADLALGRADVLSVGALPGENACPRTSNPNTRVRQALKPVQPVVRFLRGKARGAVLEGRREVARADPALL